MTPLRPIWMDAVREEAVRLAKRDGQTWGKLTSNEAQEYMIKAKRGLGEYLAQFGIV